MTNYEEEIAAAEKQAEASRAELPNLADAVVAAAAEWASKEWEDLIRRAINDDPDRAKTQAGAMPALKADLASLRERASELARQHLAPWLLHEHRSDEELTARAERRSWGRSEVEVSLPRASGRSDPLRTLISEIGPALITAGLGGGPDDVIERPGRFRYSLPDSNRVHDALHRYERALTAMIKHLFEASEMRHAKNQAEAASLWDDA